MAISPEFDSPPIEPASRSEAIAVTLRNEILRGQYRPGERLPSERDLALRFQTGRGPVREALKRLEQLGIASIQHGGARAVAIEDCTLDVLGPLLELDEHPDPRLVDQIMEIFGVLVHVAARAAIRDASDEQMAEIKRRALTLLDEEGDQYARHKALREFTHYLVKVADHLVLTLIMNGLVAKFQLLHGNQGIRIDLDSAAYREIAAELCRAVDDRDYERVGNAMHRLNRFFRDIVGAALQERRSIRNPGHV